MPPELASWHPRERLWSASVALRGVDGVAWGIGSAPLRHEARALASAHARDLLELGEVHPRSTFLSWLVRAIARGLLSHDQAALLTPRSTDLPSMLAILDRVCTTRSLELSALRVEAVELRARLRAVARSLVPRALP
jgi:hypothetical protein